MPGETAQTLDRGLRLLTLVADAPSGLTITEAADRLGVDGLEASVGVVSLGPLDLPRVGPRVISAATDIATALS